MLTQANREPDARAGPAGARGSPLRRFDPELEREYLEQYHGSVQPRVQVAMYVALVMVVGLDLMDRWLLRLDNGGACDLIRYGLQLPLILLALHYSSPEHFQRRFLPVAPTAALLFVLGSELLATDISGAGVALLSTRVVLAAFFIYFLLGLSFRVALRTNALLLGGYVALAVIAHLEPGIAAYQAFLLLCANLFAGVGAYALEHASRLAFLERRLLTEVATHDALTGLFNRRAFDEEIQRLWDQAQRERLPIAVVMIDIDHFKAFNDCYGHLAGDECLRRVAHAVQQAASRRPLDFVARFGGEELVVVLFGAELEFAGRAGRAAVDEVARLAIEHAASPTRPHVTVSIGATSVAPHEVDSPSVALRDADRALYQAKAAGRNRCVLLRSGGPAPAAPAATPAGTDEGDRPATPAGEAGLPAWEELEPLHPTR